MPEVIDLLGFCLADVGETTEEWSSVMAWRGDGRVWGREEGHRLYLYINILIPIHGPRLRGPLPLSAAP